MIDGIFFDLDGTLWDSCRVVSESWGETLRRDYGMEGGPTPFQVKGIMGMTADEIADTLFTGYGPRSKEICLACIHGENDYIALHGGDVYPGVPECSKRSLSGIRFLASPTVLTAIASASSKAAGCRRISATGPARARPVSKRRATSPSSPRVTI